MEQNYGNWKPAVPKKPRFTPLIKGEWEGGSKSKAERKGGREERSTREGEGGTEPTFLAVQKKKKKEKAVELYREEEEGEEKEVKKRKIKREKTEESDKEGRREETVLTVQKKKKKAKAVELYREEEEEGGEEKEVKKRKIKRENIEESDGAGERESTFLAIHEKKKNEKAESYREEEGGEGKEVKKKKKQRKGEKTAGSDEEGEREKKKKKKDEAPGGGEERDSTRKKKREDGVESEEEEGEREEALPKKKKREKDLESDREASTTKKKKTEKVTESEEEKEEEGEREGEHVTKKKKREKVIKSGVEEEEGEREGEGVTEKKKASEGGKPSRGKEDRERGTKEERRRERRGWVTAPREQGEGETDRPSSVYRTCSSPLSDSQYNEIFQSVLQQGLDNCLEDTVTVLNEVESLQASIDQHCKGDDAEFSETKFLNRGKDSGKGKKKAGGLPLHKTGGRERSRNPDQLTPKKEKKKKNEQREEGDEREQCECWVQCCRRACGKWRKLPDSIDPAALPEDWTCSHNTDAKYSRCEAPEESWSGGEDSTVYSDLVPGSIVWARQCGFPWWPAMVDQDPDTGNCFLFKKESDKEPLKCHLTYFGKPATRAWVSVSMIKSFQEQPETGVGAFQKKGGQRDCSKKVNEAVKMAKKAQKLSLKKRLSQFGFGTRYDGEERLSSEDSDTAEVLGIFLTDSSRRGERCSLSDEEHRPKPSKKRKKTLSKGKDLSLGKARRERKEKKGGKVSEETVKSKSVPRFGTKENKPLEISAHKAPVRKFALPKTRDQRVPGGERSPDSRRGEETGAPPDPEQETLYSFTWSKTSSQAAELQKRAGEEGEGEAGGSPDMGQGEGVQEEESITLVLREEGGSEGEEGSEREEEGSINKAVLGYPVQDKGFDKGGGGGKDLPMFSEDDEDEDMEILTCRQAVETALEEEEDFSLYLFEEE